MAYFNLGAHICVHTGQYGIDGSYITPFKGVRVDDISASNWTGSSMAGLKTEIAIWFALGVQILFTLDASWGSDMSGHMRVVYQQTGHKITAMGLPNEPDYNEISGATYAGYAIACRRDCIHLPNFVLVGGELSGFTVGHPARTFWTDFVTAKGRDALDVCSLHPYCAGTCVPGDSTNGVAAQINAFKAVCAGKEIICTEWGQSKTWYNALHGANTWSAELAGADYVTAIDAANSCGVPIWIYQMPNPDGDDGFAFTYWLNGAWSGGTGWTALGTVVRNSGRLLP